MKEEVPDGRPHVVWPEKLVRGDDSEFRALFDALGLEWRADFCDPALWHH